MVESVRIEEATAAGEPATARTLSDRAKAKAQAVPVGTAVVAACVIGLFIAGLPLLAFGVLVAALGSLEAFIWADARGLSGFKRIFAVIGFLLVLPCGAVATVALLLGLSFAFNFIKMVLLLAFLGVLIWALVSLPFHAVGSLLNRRARQRGTRQ